MRLNELKPAAGSRKDRKRIGRGAGSGHGKTAGKGHKGQKARAGGGVVPWFEGGQMPLQRRVPKRGFRNPFRKVYAVVNVGDLQRFEPGTTVGPEELARTGLAKKKACGIKLLADGELKKALSVRVHKASAAAVAKVEAAGGRVEILS